MTEAKEAAVELPLLDVFDRKTLDALVAHILDSGALGRSKIYAHLLRFLVTSAGEATSPKEIEIAMEVLGRDVNFDVSKDSVVRVYVHQLRKKLDRYYKEHYPIKFGRRPGYRIIIPKGEYTVAAVKFQPELDEGQSPTPAEQQLHADLWRRNKRSLLWWLVAATILLAGNLGFIAYNNLIIKDIVSPLREVAEHDIWQGILSGDVPLLVVVGDYYIFGELDEAGNVKRMVREFNINSKLDLEDLFMTRPELAWKYYDLDLSYIPEGTAFALNSVSAILPYGNKAIDVKMMSELTTEDITNHHIIYIGYISGLDRLQNMVFASSGLVIGENYDELVNKRTQQSYISDAGLPSFSEPFTDYGLLSFFPSANSNQILVIAGMRDAGLVQTSRAISHLSQLDTIEDALIVNTPNSDEVLIAYEVLYEIRGLNRKNFNARLVYSNHLDPEYIWKNELSGVTQ